MFGKRSRPAARLSRRAKRARAQTRRFFRIYTKDLTAEEFQRLFTRDARDAYRFFTRGVDAAALAALPWHRRVLVRIRLFFLAFTLKLSPARRAVYGIALVTTAIGTLKLFQGVTSVPVYGPFSQFGVPTPTWTDGTLWLIAGFVLVNLLVLLEVADRLTLKDDLEIAREIQQAMLPHGTAAAADVEAAGQTRPANTVGGDFYDLLHLPDGRLVVVLGDVAGKGSPAALLMALLLAMLRTLVDERLEPGDLIERLNVQVSRQAPPSRFITLFLGAYDPSTGSLTYVNAGQTPPLLRRQTGVFDRLPAGGMALGMFEGSRYRTEHTSLAPGDLLVLYSDGVTEAEDRQGRPLEEAGLERVIDAHRAAGALDLGAAVFTAVERHTQETRLADDLTVLILRRLPAAA